MVAACTACRSVISVRCCFRGYRCCRAAVFVSKDVNQASTFQSVWSHPTHSFVWLALHVSFAVWLKKCTDFARSLGFLFVSFLLMFSACALSVSVPPGEPLRPRADAHRFVVFVDSMGSFSSKGETLRNVGANRGTRPHTLVSPFDHAEGLPSGSFPVATDMIQASLLHTLRVHSLLGLRRQSRSMVMSQYSMDAAARIMGGPSQLADPSDTLMHAGDIHDENPSNGRLLSIPTRHLPECSLAPNTDSLSTFREKC